MTDEVWQYLMQVKSPWGANNKELVTLYKNANSGDCPLVVDTTTASCGNSRFGCWVCTVVKRDKSMEGLIENGEEWMEPLIEFRDLLVESRDNAGWREDHRRNNDEGPGPYTPDVRAMFLEKLLKAQFEIQRTQTEMSLISYQELVAIQVTWYRDTIFKYNVADIFNSIYGTKLSFYTEDEKTLKEKELLKNICKDKPKDFVLLEDLLTLQKTKTILMNNRGLQNDLENRIDQFIQKGK